MFFRKKNKFKKNIQATQKPLASCVRPEKKRSLLKKTKILVNTLLIVLIILGCVKFGIYLKAKYADFPINKIRIVATYEHVNPNELSKIMQALVSNSFFDLKVLDLKEQILEKLPWVNSVSIKRVWPSAIVITIVEQKPIANWKNEALLNENGQLFNPPKETFPKNLPLFSGQEDQIQEILHNYNQMNVLLSGMGWKIAKLDVDKHASWRIDLNTGISLLIGAEDVMERLQNFMLLYPKILASHRNGVISSIDLRYKNGLAVKWN